MASLIFHYATMNAGKSAFLLTSANNYQERGMDVLILKPSVDMRDSDHEVVSRVGLRKEANIVTPEMNIFEFYKWAESQKDIHCIFVDEAQFLTPRQVKQLAKVVDIYGIPVMCYGLRTDFRGELFEGSKALMSIADKLVELKGICHCGKKTTMVARIREDGSAVSDGDQVMVGGNDSYVSLCRKHWCELVGEYE